MFINCQAWKYHSTLEPNSGSLIYGKDSRKPIAACRPATSEHDNLKECEDMFDACLRGDGPIWFVVACRIVWPLAHLYILDLPIVDDEHMTLAPDVAKSAPRTRVTNGHAILPGELASGIRKEPDNGAFDLLILCPCLHDGTIVHAVDKHLSDAFRLQLRLLSQITRNLL
jgi:hypothetical protein